MSDARRFDRRSLFDLLRRPRGAPSFSLEVFYAHRAENGERSAALPRFAVREDLAAVETVPPFAEPIAPVNSPGAKSST
jgi:hypothetical protein